MGLVIENWPGVIFLLLVLAFALYFTLNGSEIATVVHSADSIVAGLLKTKTPLPIAWPVNGKQGQQHESQQWGGMSPLGQLLSSPYKPPFWLRSGHLQTVWAAQECTKAPEVVYTRELFEVFPPPHRPDLHKGVVSLDWAALPGQEGAKHEHDAAPVVLILHGLTGGSQEAYVKRCAHRLLTAGFRVVVLNQRGCGGNSLITPQAYCAAYTDDLRQVVAELRRRFGPTRPLFAIGFSLGSNIVVKYMAEEGESCTLQAGMSVANPFHLSVSSRVLHSSFLMRAVYARTLAGNLTRLFRKHAHHFEGDKRYDMNAVLRARSVREFDSLLTSRTFGYGSVDEYYEDASCARLIDRVGRPLLCLNALDDPISSKHAIPYDAFRRNPYLLLVTTQCGGHSMDWYHAAAGSALLPLKLIAWSSEVATAFFRAALSLPPPPLPPLAAGTITVTSPTAVEMREEGEIEQQQAGKKKGEEAVVLSSARRRVTVAAATATAASASPAFANGSILAPLSSPSVAAACSSLSAPVLSSPAQPLLPSCHSELDICNSSSSSRAGSDEPYASLLPAPPLSIAIHDDGEEIAEGRESKSAGSASSYSVLSSSSSLPPPSSSPSSCSLHTECLAAVEQAKRLRALLQATEKAIRDLLASDAAAAAGDDDCAAVPLRPPSPAPDTLTIKEPLSAATSDAPNSSSSSSDKVTDAAETTTTTTATVTTATEDEEEEEEESMAAMQALVQRLSEREAALEQRRREVQMIIEEKVARLREAIEDAAALYLSDVQ